MTPAIPIFDGHNDVLGRLQHTRPEQFLERNTEGHLDLPRAREGGLAGGLFAVFAEDPARKPLDERMTFTDGGFWGELEGPVDATLALRQALTGMACLFRLEAAAAGALRVVRTADELDACLDGGVFAAVLHFEGAEPIDPGLDALHVFYQAGLRSLGPVWSRPNVFGTGVPFRYPATPDWGGGLTPAGRALVQTCNVLGVLIDLAHMNEKGFWDVARLSTAPLVVTHAGAAAITPSARNLTDSQLDAIGESDGLVGVTYFVADLREDGRWDVETPISQIVKHVRYIAERIGVAHVALGSDFDGARIPAALGDVTGLPRLMAALRAAGFDDAELHQIAHANWQRVLRATWRGGA
ncbi:MAG: dipeptidase [Anaerolineae bacterium]